MSTGEGGGPGSVPTFHSHGGSSQTQSPHLWMWVTVLACHTEGRPCSGACGRWRVGCRGMQLGGPPDLLKQVGARRREEESLPSVLTHKGLMGAEGPTDPHPDPVSASAAPDPRASRQAEQRPPGMAGAQHALADRVRDGAVGWGHVPWLGRPRW